MKNGNEELSQIWKVGQSMWKRDYPGAYSALQATWSDNVQHIMVAVRG